jgi:hypothetical protein
MLWTWLSAMQSKPHHFYPHNLNSRCLHVIIILHGLEEGRNMKKEQIAFRIQVIVEPDEGEYHAYCPALKGLHTGGTTQEEA